jgi:hypothetical protein
MWSSGLSHGDFLIVYQRLGGNYCVHLQGGWDRKFLRNSGNMYEAKRCHNPNDHDSNHSSMLFKSWSQSRHCYGLIFYFGFHLFFQWTLLPAFFLLFALSLVLSFVFLFAFLLFSLSVTVSCIGLKLDIYIYFMSSIMFYPCFNKYSLYDA